MHYPYALCREIFLAMIRDKMLCSFQLLTLVFSEKWVV
jgi:hypothetical protein